MKIKHQWRGFLLVVIGLSLYPSTITVMADTEDSQLREITIATPYDFDQYSFWNNSDPVARLWLNTLKAGLYERSPENGYQFVPSLANDYPELSTDQLTATVDLKPDLKFSNGNPLTAEDVVFSYKVALTPEINYGANPYYSKITGVFEHNSSISQIDDDTIQFQFSQISPFYLDFLNLNIIDKDLFKDEYNDCEIEGIENACGWDSPTGNYAMGAGPFKLDTLDIESGIISVVKNPYFLDYDNIKADKITFKSITSAEIAISALINGEVDIVDSQYLIEKANFTDYDYITSEITPELGHQEIALNHHHPYFGSGELIPDGIGISDNNFIQASFVRKAMSHIVNRERIISEITDGIGVPAYSPIAPGTIGYDATVTPREYSVETARDYMEKAGFDYEKLGTEYDNQTFGKNFFNISIILPNNNLQRMQWARLYAEDLPKIGIGVDNYTETGWDGIYERVWYWTSTEWGVYLDLEEFVPLYDDGGYDIFFIGWLYNQFNWHPEESGYTEPYGGCNTDIYCNFYNYNNATVRGLLTDYISELDVDKHAELIPQIQLAFHQDNMLIPIIHGSAITHYQNNLENFDVLGYLYQQNKFDSMYKSDWDIDTERPKDDDSDGGFIGVLYFYHLFVLIPITIIYQRKRS